MTATSDGWTDCDPSADFTPYQERSSVMALRKKGPVVVVLETSTLGELMEATRELELEFPRETEVRVRVRKAFHARGGLVIEMSAERA